MSTTRRTFLKMTSIMPTIPLTSYPIIPSIFRSSSPCFYHLTFQRQIVASGVAPFTLDNINSIPGIRHQIIHAIDSTFDVDGAAITQYDECVYFSLTHTRRLLPNDVFYLNIDVD